MSSGETYQQKLKKLQSFSSYLPGIIIIRKTDNFDPVFISENGLELFNSSLEEIQKQEDNFQNSFFHNEDIFDYQQKLKEVIQANADRQFTFFQQLKISPENEWIWHICTVKIFHYDKDGNATHIISIANSVNHLKHLPNKINRLVSENLFFKQNFEKFAALGKREKEVLKLVAFGKSSQEIAQELFISIDTVNTHRKNIKEKLNISSNYGFSQYAQAFDLL